MKVIELIGRDAQHTVSFQRGCDCVQEITRENPPLLMPPLRPRIGKQKVKRFHRTGRQQIAHRKQSVRAQHSHVVDPRRFPANFLNPLRQPFDAEEVFALELFRQFAQKGTIAAAEVDLQGPVAFEKLPQIETSDMQFRYQFEHMEKCRLRINAATSAIH